MFKITYSKLAYRHEPLITGKNNYIYRSNCHSSSTSIARSSSGNSSSNYSPTTSGSQRLQSQSAAPVQCFKGTMLPSLVVEENSRHTYPDIQTNNQSLLFSSTTKKWKHR